MKNENFASTLIEEQPQVIEMEKFVLGAMLLKDGEIIPDVAAIVDTADFYRPEHRDIFKAIMTLYAKKITPSILSLTETLRETKDEHGKNLLDKIGMEYVLGITEVAFTTAFAEEYARRIKEKSELRKLQRLGEKLIQAATEGIKPPLDIIADTQNAFNSFSTQTEEDKFFNNVGNYMVAKFLTNVEKNKPYFDRKSGFYNIDQQQIFRPGLYVLGATPACGKTTFAWQLLEQFAERGEHCIFCSYEMEKDELIAKSIARNLFLRDNYTSLTSGEILNGGYSDSMANVMHDFCLDQLNFDVREFSTENVDKLLAILRPIVKNADKAPIVCIDYLQRLIPRDVNVDKRAAIDDALYKLKDFSKETKTTFFVISTFNRTNYNVPVSFECFKESGGIEYTADVVWAMQLNIATKLSGEKEGIIRQKIEAAKKSQPREINISCLKNRRGNNYSCYFQYYSAHDYFKPCEESDFIISKIAPADEDDKDD